MKAVAWLLSAVLIFVYAVDIYRHGEPALWHLLFLLALYAPQACSAFYGINLAKMEEQGRREYYVKYMRLSSQEVQLRIERDRRFAYCVVAAALVAYVAAYAWDAIGPNHPLSAWGILIVLTAFGGVALSVLVFGVSFALWKIGHQ